MLPSTLEEDVILFEKTIMHLSWASQRRLAQQLAEFHLTVPQYVALRAIQHEQNGCTMTRLAEASYQVAATMTGIIDRLAEQGLVERARDANDRRTQRVVLTESGRAQIDEIERRSRMHMQRLLETLSPTERQQMIRLMQQYLDVTLKESES